MNPGSSFLREARSLEAAYLQSDDPMVQSGFSGGRNRWVTERSPLIDGIDGDGDFLDVGCANGLLTQDVVRWAANRAHVVAPHGVDIGPRLVGLARDRLPVHAANFHTDDAWTWEPRRRWNTCTPCWTSRPMICNAPG